jgi:ABC-type phosphate transport system substrate-binding protein
MSSISKTSVAAVLVVSLCGACGGAEWVSERAAELSAADVDALKAKIVAIASANTTRDDNIAQVRSQLQPLVDQLAAYFAANRPANELALTRRAWRSLWYDDKDIDNNGPGFIELDRSSIYQVVEDGYYYNVCKSGAATPQCGGLGVRR